MTIQKCFSIKGDYIIPIEFENQEELMSQLKDYGYEGEYDEQSWEMNEALDQLFDGVLSTKFYCDSTGHHIQDVRVDTETFSSEYIFNS